MSENYLDATLQHNGSLIVYLQPSNSSLAGDLRYSVPWTFGLIFMHVFVFLTGSLGNGVVIFVLFRKPQTQTAHNIFLLNLAVTDLLVTLFCVPANLTFTIWNFGPWGQLVCDAAMYIQEVFGFAGAYSLVVIAINRCHGIHRLMRMDNRLSKRQTVLMITLIWVAAVLVPFTPFFTFKPVDPSDVLNCWETRGNTVGGKIYFLCFNLVCCYGAPFFILFFVNTSIWCKVSRRQIPQNLAAPEALTQLHDQTRSKVRLMLAFATLTFLFSWLPMNVILTRVILVSSVPIKDYERKVLVIVVPVAQLLRHCNSSLNPISYTFCSTNIRKTLLQIFGIQRMF